MGVISETNFSKIEERLDAEYFKPKYIKIEKNLEKLVKSDKIELIKLKDISNKVRKGIFSINKNEYVSKGIPFIRVGNINEILIDNDDITYITEQKNCYFTKHFGVV